MAHRSRWSIPIIALLLASACSAPDSLDVVGLLEWDRVELIAETSEPIVEILVTEGTHVAAGQLILRQDSRREQAQLDEAISAQAQAAARLAELRRGPRAERIAGARARLRGAKSEAELLQHEYQRQQALAAKKLASPEALDDARIALDKAVANRDASAAELDELLAGTTREELQQAEAALARTDAQVRDLQVALEHLAIRAPQAGRLDRLPFEVGEQPQAGAVVAVLLAGEAPYARVYVPEPLHARVRYGNRARIFIDGFDQPFAGRVRMISRDAVFTPYYSLTERDRSRLSYLAEVSLEGPQAAELPSGTPLRVEFIDGAGRQP